MALNSKQMTGVGAAAVAVAAAIGLGAAVGLRHAESGAEVTPVAAGVTSSAATAASTCPPLDSNSAQPSQAPATSWDYVGGAALPKTAAGPGVTSGVERRCYAHTPTGAVVAGATLASLMGVKGGTDQVLNNQMTGGPVRDSVLSNSAKNPVTDGTSLPQLRGFKIRSYDGNVAMVQYAWASGGQLYSSTSPLIWDDDWKLDGNPQKPVNPVQPLTSLGDFVPWSAVTS